MKFVTALSSEDRVKLDELRLSDPSSRVRVRAHAILLSNKGYPINEIAMILSVDRDSISSWIDAWEKSSFGGLADRPRSGRPAILDAKERDTALELIRENPQSMRTVLDQLRQATGKSPSRFTLKRLAKRAGLNWKRIRRSARSKRDEAAFREAKAEIASLRDQERRGEINLYFFDESGFCLEPCIPYAWQPKGEHIEVPTVKGSCFNVLGFFTEDNAFEPFLMEASVNSDVVIACFDAFTRSLTKPTVVVIDNAPTHTSNRFNDRIEQWQRQGLFLKRLPAYSPELNCIEILWRFMKYLWLPFSAYRSLETLVKAVEDILRGVGSKYRITFA